MKKLFTGLMTVLVLLGINHRAAAQYCTTGLYTTYGCTDNDFINSFSTSGGSTNISTSNTGCSCACAAGYTFYSTQTHTQMAGTTVSFSLANTPNWPEGYKIWVDFDHNNAFDPTEEVYASAATIPAGGTASGSFAIPATALPGNTRLRVRCVYATTTFTSCSNHTFGEVEDYNFVVIPLTPCSGAPTAGNLYVSNNCPTIISPNGITLAGNMHIQWQQKIVCGGSWVDIPNDTGYSKTILSQTVPTQYRMYIKCLTTGQTDTAAPILISSVAPCYCTSAASSTADEEILNVTVGTQLNNSSTCTSTGGPGSILNKYSNYTTSLPAVVLNKGGYYPFSVEIGTCGGNYNNAVKIFIDFNQDGVFDPTMINYNTPNGGELVYVSPASQAGPHTESGVFQVPMSANPGIGRIRIVNVETITPSSIDPCAPYTWGETEDYATKILYAPTISGPGINSTTHIGAFCSGDNVVLNASAPGVSANYKFLWQKPNGNFIYDSTSIHLNNVQAGIAPFGNAGIYKLYVITFPCAGGTPDTSGAGDVTIAITQTPPMPIVNSNIVFCMGAPFDSIPIYGAGLTWYASPTATIGSLTTPIVNTSVLGTATYYVSQKVNGCEGPRKPVSLTVAPKPAPPSVVSPVVYCQGDVPDQLHATGINVKWYPVSTGGLGTPLTPTPGTNAQGVFTWFVTQTIAGCESNRVPVTINVNYIPNAIIAISRPYVCQYDTISITYFGNATNTADYIWSLPTGAFVSSGSGQGPLIVRFDSAGSRRVHLQVDNGGCKGPATFLDIDVRALPQLTLDMQPDACIGDIVNLAVGWSSTSIDSYNWNFDNGSQAYGVTPTGPYGLVWTNSGQKIITVVATDNDCDSRPVHDTIMIHPNPDAHINNVNNVSICAGDSILLEAIDYPNATYRWQPENFFRAEHTYREWAVVDKPSWIYLTITSEFNCKGKDSLYVDAQPCCKVVFPNAFTPNGDGKNDVFRMIKKGGTLNISVFRIFNRWGQIVFDSANDKIGWDGTCNGVPQDMDTYHYYTKYKCADGNYYEEKGEVTLIR